MMVGSSKILTVSYGTFSCTLEGFDDPFSAMKSIAEYFRDLAADDRFFGAEPPTPDVEMIHRITEREVQRRVETRVHRDGVTLRQMGHTEADTATLPAAEPVEEPEPAPAGEKKSKKKKNKEREDSVAEKLSRIRASVEKARVGAVAGDELADESPDDDDEAYAEDDTDETRLDSAIAGVMIPDDDEDEIETEEAVAEPDVDMAAEDELDDAPEAEEHPEIAQASEEDVAEAPADDTEDADETVAADADEMDEADDADEDLAAELDAEDEDDTPDEIAAEADAEDDVFGDEEAYIQAAATPDEVAETPAPQPAAYDPATPVIARADVPDTGLSLADRIARLQSAEEAHGFLTDDDPDNLVDDAAPQSATAPAPVEEPVAPVASEIEADEDEPGEIAAQEAAPAVEDEPAPAEAAEREEEAEPVAETGEPVAEETPEVSEPVAEDEADEDEEIAAEADDADAHDDDADDERQPEAQSPEPLTLTSASRAPAAPENAPAPAAQAQDAAQDAKKKALIQTDLDNEPGFNRILRETNTKMAESEGTRRRSAIAHLKAAVAATKADRLLKRERSTDEDAEEQSRYREDLAKVVRPRKSEPAEPIAADKRPKPIDTSAAPLMLVSAQRVDGGKAGPQDADEYAVRPRRIGAGMLALDQDSRTDDEDDDEDSDFVAFAKGLGARELPDVLEAAAAYTAFVENQPHFSRPQIMRRAAAVETDEEFTREAGLRSFGQLLRQGRIRKLQRGQFTIAETTRFRPQARIAGE